MFKVIPYGNGFGVVTTKYQKGYLITGMVYWSSSKTLADCKAASLNAKLSK